MAPLLGILALLAGTALAAVTVHYWPRIMSWAREHLLPWVERNVPELAESVRLAFHDLDQIAVELRRAVRLAWRRLRNVLLSQTVTFVEKAGQQWAVQITSDLRDSEQHEERVVTEQHVDWDELPADIRAQALLDGISDHPVDILKARDTLLTDTS